MNAPLELISIVIYLFVLIAMSVAFSRMNKNVSDYFRSGCQGTWWLVGSSSKRESDWDGRLGTDPNEELEWVLSSVPDGGRG